MTIAPREPQSLILEERVKEEQRYYPNSNHNEVLSNSIDYPFLSNVYIKRLKELKIEEAKQPLNKIRKSFVLEEGILTDKKWGLGNLLISIQYNFSEDKPFIEVPGKYIDICQDKRRRIYMRVLILKPEEQMTFIERILKKSHETSNEYAYTGDYLIWPGCMEPNALKRRKIKI